MQHVELEYGNERGGEIDEATDVDDESTSSEEEFGSDEIDDSEAEEEKEDSHIITPGTGKSDSLVEPEPDLRRIVKKSSSFRPDVLHDKLAEQSHYRKAKKESRRSARDFAKLMGAIQAAQQEQDNGA
ncbi:MAG: hypothetical protein MHM6MM_000880 [Cercozoa sp. M6MM]